MTFLPIVARELRVAARRRGIYWTRTAIALGAIVIGVLLYLANIDLPAQSASQRIFSGLLILSIFFCLLAGRRSSADCLSEEKREGTLGLLFLTDLKGYDIVLGKLSATSLSGFYSLLAVLPVLAVPMLMGGITNGEFWRAALVLANSFLFSLAVGIFVSSFSRQARRAMGVNLLLLLLLIGFPGAVAAALAFFLPSHPFFPSLLLSCPVYSLYLCDDSVYRFNREYFWLSVILVHVLTWLLLGLASWVVPHSWQDRPPATKVNLSDAGKSLNSRTGSRKREYRRRLLDVNPFYWLSARSMFKPLQVWAVMLFIAVWWLWATLQFGTLWLAETTSGTNIATAIMLNVALKLWIGLEACRQLSEDRKAGALELLLSTSLSGRDVLRGQWLALKRQFLLPVLCSIAVAFVFMVHSIQHSPIDHGIAVAGWLGGILMFVIDVISLVWCAMYCALTSRNQNQATVMAISRIVIAPTLVFIGLANAATFLTDGSEPPFRFYLAGWFGLGILTDLLYGLTARRSLLSRFRQLACEDKPRIRLISASPHAPPIEWKVNSLKTWV